MAWGFLREALGGASPLIKFKEATVRVFYYGGASCPNVHEIKIEGREESFGAALTYLGDLLTAWVEGPCGTMEATVSPSSPLFAAIAEVAGAAWAVRRAEIKESQRRALECVVPGGAFHNGIGPCGF